MNLVRCPFIPTSTLFGLSAPMAALLAGTLICALLTGGCTIPQQEDAAVTAPEDVQSIFAEVPVAPPPLLMPESHSASLAPKRSSTKDSSIAPVVPQKTKPATSKSSSAQASGSPSQKSPQQPPKSKPKQDSKPVTPVAEQPAPQVIPAIPEQTISASNFGFANVKEVARELASKPFASPKTAIPEELRSLNYEQWTQLRFREEHTLWKNEDIPFEVQFFHPGSVYDTPVKISVVDNGKALPVTFSSDMFEIANPELATALREAPLDFAGLRLLFPILGGLHKDEVASFLGATFFRAVSRDAGYGLSALGLTVDTATPEGEEIPCFREFWLVKPAPGATTLTIYAIMDSPSMTGAYTFTLTPGETTFMDVSCTLFSRNGAKTRHKLGIAPMSSMYLSGGGISEDGSIIPEVHNSDGLLLRNDNGQWVWMPLDNPKRLAFHSYELPNPRGFGLIQRDDVAEHYSANQAAYQRRPSLWVEPQGNWGSGHLELIEIPSKTEIHNNIIAFWIPETPHLFSADTGQAGISYAYRLHWMRAGAAPHSLGRVASTKVTVNSEEGTTDFIVDFTGEEINAIPADTGLSCPVVLPEETILANKQLTKNPETGGWTLSFQVKTPKDEGLLKTILPNMRQALPPLQFQAVLKRGENIPDPLTETWLFDLQR